ncbi:hypothetical protein [Microvirga tunisiensis]|uniref:Uncharacterized protein n=1 Tax=Microvirga tunisiensis TaxID=2108360 RepID=A0A5N7MSA0_9HYPH|nr:hypothetical protein [Microvirga tunisiensis]MPR11800.1 hypothetical protein [Microvirga tunisiensis]MPR29833.1 hypothetical protein [Microvirga tunisiensis]
MQTLLFINVEQTVIWLPMLIAGFCLFKMKSNWRWLVSGLLVLLVIPPIYGNFLPGGNQSFAVFGVLFAVIGFLAGAAFALLLRNKPQTA